MTENKKRSVWARLVAALAGVVPSTVLDLVGAALIVAGIALWSVPVALVVAGLLVLVAAHPLPSRWFR
tara:strand:- start:311 stop:514 length:204 start_codon:yes stop_codon:yes gene_type:complete